MSDIDFNNKTFLLVENSENGLVNSETTFEYRQDGDMVTADYRGGVIKYGKIIAVLKDRQLDMRYQCLTSENELRSGQAIAEISFTEQHKLSLKLNWQWLGDHNMKGTSYYIEI